MGDLVHKTKVVPFINVGTKENPKWIQIKKSTSFTLSMNPQTKTFDFISSETPENEIDSYQPSLGQSLTMFKGEPDYEEIFKMLYTRPTGEKAHRDVLIVWYKEKASYNDTEVYKSWKVDALVTINQMDTVNETIDFDLAFNDIENGGVKLVSGSPFFGAGDFDDTAKTFTPKDAEAFDAAA